MHILPAIHRETRYLMPLLAIVLLGLSLIFVTWQNLRQQRQAVEQHMVLAARVVAMGIEGNMVWRMRGPGRMATPRLSGKEFLQELLTSPDLVLVGVVGPTGQMMLASEDPENVPAIPHSALETLRSEQQWHGFARHRGQDILLYVHQLKHPAARHMHESFLPPTHETRGHPSYLVLGLDMSEHMVMYNDARRAALWQGGYVLASVVLLWIGAVKLLQRREQGAKVKELEQFQARLVDNLPDGLLTVDAEGIIRGANPSAVILLGDDKPLPGRRWEDLDLNQESMGQPPEQDLGQVLGQDLAQVKHQRGQHGAAQDERNLQGASSSNLPGNSSDMSWRSFSFADRHLEILAVPLRADERELGERLVLVRDRTAIRKLEDSLQESERLAAIGRLAAAVAHEIRNPLSALRGFAQFFAGKLAGREPEETYARTMVAEADRLNRVITDLLFLAKPKSPEKSAVRLPELLGSVETLLHTDLDRHGIEIRSHFDQERTVWADPDLLKQCLLNLLMNAVQAVAENKGGEAGVIEVHMETGLEGLWVVIRDNGPGMNAEQRQRALEPFYTTRKDGSGLGLAIVRKIVRDHGGRLEITSSPGQGARVSMFFPQDAPGQDQKAGLKVV
ncbi:two-component system sensor histidine kinase NtrB [Desulfonatronum thioautotrophicum]|uniref:two-component system sensor histidine kinase NtrB n=1 Tax=Desulfonatronum thioautotrophicum TaxID=617001 RepID=UPI0005EBB0AB|nr:ATP-binding protein [Desulfonatronum thioautotrophicum]